MSQPRPVAAVREEALRYAARYGGVADFYGTDGEAQLAAFSVLIRVARGSDRLPEAVGVLAAELGRTPTAEDVLVVLNGVMSVPAEVAGLIRAVLGS